MCSTSNVTCFVVWAPLLLAVDRKLTQESGHAGQDGQQGGGAEPWGGQRRLLGEADRLSVPLPPNKRPGSIMERLCGVVKLLRSSTLSI